MSQFVLFLWSDTSRPPDMSPAEMQAVVKEYSEWTEKLRREGRLVWSQRLSDVFRDPGRRLKGTGDELSVTDRSLPETKEVVGGFYQIEASDYAEAVKIASGCPHLEGRGARIEIREVWHP